MLVAGIQASFGLDPRLKHSGVTTWGKVIRGPLDTPQLAAGLFIIENWTVMEGKMTPKARKVLEALRKEGIL